VYGQLVSLLGKYSKFASAGEKATLRQAAQTAAPAAAEESDSSSDATL
jgi:myo-inositol-1(or 4)-monophosphatase